MAARVFTYGIAFSDPGYYFDIDLSLNLSSSSLSDCSFLVVFYGDCCSYDRCYCYGYSDFLNSYDSYSYCDYSHYWSYYDYRDYYYHEN